MLLSWGVSCIENCGNKECFGDSSNKDEDDCLAETNGLVLLV